MWSDDQRRQFRDLLVAMFSREELEAFSRDYLDQRLDTIAAPAAMPAMVGSLVDWYQRRGRWSELLEKVDLYVARENIIRPDFVALKAAIQADLFTRATRPAAGGEAPAGGPLGKAVRKLLPDLLSGDVVVYVGDSTSVLDDSPCFTAHDLSRSLLHALRFIRDPYEHLLPPPDLAGSYFAISEGQPALDNKVTGILAQRLAAPNSDYEAIAKLMRAVESRRGYSPKKGVQ